ncbi:peptidoglycan editing factor PgeF [Roseinatronobacter alkalisoli]|uniref:Purine nucleoside phosphorylase n=1 Tax=Roseinatronobacter alkalisoli TaxID=3028235 RepID=A0ABT5T954_9RHOB|nr:peptidoglycan editing factor PgeF [Roseinatronobacter sp. HJB301]MDD7971654.1 peptidoglycan editing factor PgeF [Roseinatronobacter sp. HJB301]
MTLEILTADSLSPLRHGFFTRRGGASSGIFAGLNCGPGSTDQSETVRTNRNRVASAMNVDPAALVTLHQTHSATVISLDGPLPDGQPRPQADAMVTTTPGLALAVLTADCQPVLFADHDAGVIGAAHAGWRGALAGVLENTLDAMEALGATRATTCAVIGPCISQRAYEVGPEFLDEFMAEDSGYARFFANGQDGRYMFDLTGFGLHRLRDAGIGDACWTGHCTYSDPAMFYSFRRSVHEGQADYGRLISTIRL